MGLEACMICLDNSDYMRNGDYSPTRLQAQAETVNFIINAKIQANPESACGILTMAGERIDTLSSPCREIGTLMTSLSQQVQVGGQSDFINGLKVAKLALKNRPNKTQKQRIVLFVGSPLEMKEKTLVQLGTKFKKDNVAVDVINFGAENSLNDNVEKLEKFIAAVNSNDNSKLVNIPPGPHILSDLVLTSPIMSDAPSSAGGSGAVGGGFEADSGGVDPSMDPELAMALRISIEEERQRQERANKENAEAEGKTAGAPEAETAETPAAVAASGDAMVDDDEDEEAMLAQAIAMSIAAAGGDDDDDDDMQVAAAVAEPTAAAEGTEENDDIAAALQDENFLSSLLESVPGVNQDDIELDDILSNLTGGGDAAKDKDKK